MTFESDVQELLGGLRIGSPQQRAQLQDCLQRFFIRQGYRAELGSFTNGTALILASPAEHALLRYDLPNLKQFLAAEGLDGVVTDVKVRTKTFAA